MASRTMESRTASPEVPGLEIFAADVVAGLPAACADETLTSSINVAKPHAVKPRVVQIGWMV
ncbi:MAG: hypothetical protein DMG61_24510 [Acidobacteria bacterium]|nr:MAG: hypothetical protein DMG61_24510 [Acidobacteriota bacterium]